MGQREGVGGEWGRGKGWADNGAEGRGGRIVGQREGVGG